MKNTMTSRYISVITVLLFLLGGCQTYNEQKQAAKDKWDKTTAKIRLDVANEQFGNGQYDSALKTVNETLAIDPKMAEGWILAGKLSLVKGQFKEAFENFSKAVEIDQDNDQAWFWLGTTAIEDGKAEYAENCLTKATELDRTKIEYVLSLAQAYIMQGKYDSAERLYEEKSSRFSDDHTIKAAAGSLAMVLGRYEKAAKYYKQAVLLSRNDPAVLESLGYCLIAAEDWGQAADTFEKLSAVALDGRQDYTKIIAVCQMNAGRYDKAKSGFDAISDTQRDNPEFWLNLGQAHLGLGAANAAIACAKRAQLLQNNWPDAIALQASGEYLNKDYHLAMANFKKIAENENIGAFAWLMIGKCCDKLGQSDKAKQAYTTSLSLKPDNAYAAQLVEKI